MLPAGCQETILLLTGLPPRRGEGVVLRRQDPGRQGRTVADRSNPGRFTGLSLPAVRLRHTERAAGPTGTSCSAGARNQRISSIDRNGGRVREHERDGGSALLTALTTRSPTPAASTAAARIASKVLSRREYDTKAARSTAPAAASDLSGCARSTAIRYPGRPAKRPFGIGVA